MKYSKTKSGLRFVDFEKEIDGKPVGLFVLSNQNGLEACFTNFGQRLVSLLVPDKNGVFDDIVLGHSSLEEYVHPESEYYFGAIIGRYANRIANGSFELEGKQYSLEINNPPNHLHGGSRGFHNVVWDAFQKAENKIEFTYISKHLEGGYPGNLLVKVDYVLTDTDDLVITYHATSDQTTIVNLTHHSYFNLKGEGNGTIEDHFVKINADYFTPINNSLIPSGEISSVKNTPFDFLNLKSIGKEIDSENLQLLLAKGYDHNFVLNPNPKLKKDLVLASTVYEPITGRIIEVHTDMPGMQFYSGNFLSDSVIGKDGQAYTKRGGLCLETQFFPNLFNITDFKNPILDKEKTYKSITVYSFKVLS